MTEKERERRIRLGLEPLIVTMDAGEKIDKFAMVQAKSTYLDYKAPIPLWFDKMVIVNVLYSRPQDVVYGESMLSRFVEHD